MIKYLVLETIILGILFYILKTIFKKELSFKYNLILLILIVSVLYIFIKLLYKHYVRFKEPYKYDELFYDKDLFSDEDDEEFKDLIYPDDYPYHSDSFLGMYFPFLQFRENRIRKKFQKFIDLEEENHIVF